MEYPATTAFVETLPNGLALILDPDSSAPVVSAQVWVETGSTHEDTHLGSGLSHFLEHMVFKGTRDHDAGTLASVVQGAGGHWNAYTSFGRTVYYIDGPAASLNDFLRVLTGLVFFPVLPEAEFEKEKDVIRREIDMGLDDPDNVLSRLLFSTAFQHDPRRHPVIGHRHLFDALKYDDLVSYHRERYTTDRCFVVIAGDFDPDAAKEQIAALTADCLRSSGREPLLSIDAPQLGPRSARGTFAIPASRVSMAWKAPALHHPDAPAFDVLAAILGRGRASRLHRRLREEKELALEISAYSWSGPGREGLLGISADTEVANRDALVAAILEEIADFSGSLDADIAKAKRQIALSQIRGLTTASGRATDLGMNWHEARDLGFTRRYLQGVSAVTADDVRRAAASLTESKLTTVVLDPLDAPAPVRSSKTGWNREPITTHKLDNGLTVALLPDRRIPLVHFQAAIRGGLPAEDVGTNGINHLLSASLPKGTTTRSGEQIAIELESLGASIGAHAGNNAILVHASGLAMDFETIARIFADVIVNPSFPADVIAREKASQLAGLGEALQDPLHVAFRELREAVFGAAGYGLDSMGSPDSLTGLERGHLVDAHARHFSAANMTVALSGDFDPAQALKILSEAFSTLPTGPAWRPPASQFSAPSDVEHRLPKKQAVLAMGFPGAAVHAPDRHALSMIQDYLADMAGPLFTRIREELGLAYQVGATQFLGYDAGLFSFYLATDPAQADLARRELLAEIGKITTEGIPADAFERTRSTVLSGLAIQQQSPAAAARHAALDLLFGLPADHHRQLPKIYQELDHAAVQEVASRVFAVAPSIATVLPEC